VVFVLQVVRKAIAEGQPVRNATVSFFLSHSLNCISLL
jgi:hypothetical protein